VKSRVRKKNLPSSLIVTSLLSASKLKVRNNIKKKTKKSGRCGKSQVIKTYQSNYLTDFFLRSYDFLLGDVGGESEKRKK
jgi:hypothetical protein